jgi:hypothetical protein
MSTSIQEQDLVQTIKELQQRVNDLERQQRTIGGWTITPSSIQTGNYNTNGTRYLGDDGLSVSNTFRVDPSGNMTATNANISGTVTSTAGTIGGWDITSNSIQTGTYNTAGTRYLGNNGISVSDKFRVDSSGNMTATSATVSGTVNASGGTFTGTVDVNGTLRSGSSGARWDLDNTPRLRFFDSTRERMRLTQDRVEFWNSSGASAGALVGGNETGVPSVSSTGKFYAPSAEIGLGMTVGGGLVLETDIPASSSASGVQGSITWDNDYIYICVATDTWKRATLNSY